MILSRRVIRRLPVAALIFVALVVVVWWALWSIAAAQYRGVIDGWIDSGRASGYEISYDDRQLFGFPRRVVTRVSNLHWKNTDGIEFHADQIDIAATPWRWQVFDASFKGHVALIAPLDAEGRGLILAGESGRAHVELDTDGFWKFSRVAMEQARIGRTPDYLFLAESLNASAERPTTPPEGHKDVGLTLTGEAKKVSLPDAMPSPFGSKMTALALDLRVMDATPDFRKKESISAWNKDSGVVQIDKLRMDWGQLQLTGKGTIGFDDDLQPEGAFSCLIDHPKDVLKALSDHGYIPERQEAMLNSALSLFGKPSKFDMDSAVELPVSVQLGGLFLGPVKIFSFPEIVWPESGGVEPLGAATPQTATPEVPLHEAAPETTPLKTPEAPAPKTPDHPD